MLFRRFPLSKTRTLDIEASPKPLISIPDFTFSTPP